MLIDLDRFEPPQLPEVAVSAITLAELAAEPMPWRIPTSYPAPHGRQARGRRALDLLIAATALGADLPLVTRNPDDFAGLDGLVDVHAVGAPGDAGPQG